MSNERASFLLTVVVAFAISATFSMPAQMQTAKFRLMQYNVENLFDTCHDVGFNDYEFLPEGSRKWNSQRYWAKLARISRVIAAASGASPIDLISLCEVENDSVVYDLCRKTKLHWLGYDYIVTKSKDVRGLDVALLYQPETFRPLSSESIEIPYTAGKERPTRDILHISGELISGDTLDVFVNHWPSRRGGSLSAERYRKRAASCLWTSADSIMRIRQSPLIVMMGDFNDEEHSPSLIKNLNAKSYSTNTAHINPKNIYIISSGTRSVKGEAKGTYKFSGEWNFLDHIMVNGVILNRVSTLKYIDGSYRIFSPSFLLEQQAGGDYSIKRTFLGPIYKGGTSDHLPVVMSMDITF